MKIEYITAADVPEALQLMHEVYDGLEIKEWFSMGTDRDLIKYMIEEEFALKVEIDGNLAGIFIAKTDLTYLENLGKYMHLQGEELNKVAHMEIAMVREGYRGLGIQKTLMMKTEEILREQGYRYLMGTAHPDNVYSVNNFQKLGYEIVTQATMYGGMPRYVFCKKIFPFENR